MPIDILTIETDDTLTIISLPERMTSMTTYSKSILSSSKIGPRMICSDPVALASNVSKRVSLNRKFNLIGENTHAS